MIHRRPAKKIVLNEDGSLGAHLGVDLFANLLLVFIISTVLLMRAPKDNTTNPSTQAVQTKSTEALTPGINLAKDDHSGAKSSGTQKALSVSAKREAGSVVYYVGNKKTSLSDIAGLLRKQHATRVELRLGEDLTNSITIKILGRLQEAHVKEIAYVFTKPITGGN